MAKSNRFRMAMGLLLGILGLFSLDTLSPAVVFAQSSDPFSKLSPPGTNSNSDSRLATQVDSLSRSVERLTIQVNSELRASETRIDGIKEATDRSFWVLIVLGAIGSIIGGAFVLGERAQEKQHHKDYMEERTFYEQRARRYERRQQETHQEMLSIAKTNEERNDATHDQVLQLYRNQVRAGQDVITQTQSLFGHLETNFAKINEITTAVASGATKNVTTLNEVLAAFQQIMQFKVKEAQLVDQIENELKEMERMRKQQVDELLKDAVRLIRKRFEFTNPDSILQRLMVEYRTKMDSISMIMIKKYTKADEEKVRDWHYGEIFLRRGVIAYYENDSAKARDMLKIAESFFPFLEQQLESMPSDQKYGAAFTRYYLALIEKNYGDIHQAKNYIEDSYIAWGKKIDHELLTPTARAEILSYAPGSIDKAREAIAEILERVKNLKRSGRPLAKHDAICAVRGHLILGNTYYVESEWEQALLHYREALKEDGGRYYPYYTYHSIAQALRKCGKETEANEHLDGAYKYLLESDHLKAKVALDSQILLNALAYLCARARKPDEALKYKQAILQHWLTIQKVDGLELRLFSLQQKRQVSKEEFWNELFNEASVDAAPRA